jgi:PKD repeat protein
MKTTYFKRVVFIVMLFVNGFIFSQYNGGNADGFAKGELNSVTCSFPIQFYAYSGGSSSLTTSNGITNTTCATPSQFYAYSGGNGDGFASGTINATVCPNPSQFYAYFGGNGDGFANQTIDAISCPNPSQFYAYFGGTADGFSFGSTAPVCPTAPPVADFTASATTICVGQSVTFTDTSTNLPSAWTWTFTGGTPNSATVQNPVIVYNTPGTYAVTLLAANFNGNDSEIKTNFLTVNAIPTVF